MLVWLLIIPSLYVQAKKELKLSNYDYKVSILNTHMSIGLAIRYTAITISAGFLILILSNFKPTILFGVFTSFALLTSFIISLTYYQIYY